MSIEWHPQPIFAELQSHQNILAWQAAALHAITPGNPHGTGYADVGADPAGAGASAAGAAITAHLAAFVHADIAHANRANLDAIDQSLAMNASPAFAGLAVDTDTLLVSASNDRVGIKTNTPTAPLDVRVSGTSTRLSGGLNFSADPGISIWGFRTSPSSAFDLNLDVNDGVTVATALTVLRATHNVGINTSSPEAQLHVVPGAIDRVGVKVQAMSGQSVNLQEWKNSVGTTVTFISSAGYLGANAFYATTFNDNAGSAYARFFFGGLNKNLTFNTDNTDRHRTDSTGLWLMGAAGLHSFGLGDPAADNSWRLILDGSNNLLTQQRVGGVWATKRSTAYSQAVALQTASPGASVTVRAFYQDFAGNGVEGLAPTCTVYDWAEGVPRIIDAQAATALGAGWYSYTIPAQYAIAGRDLCYHFAVSSVLVQSEQYAGIVQVR